MEGQDREVGQAQREAHQRRRYPDTAAARFLVWLSRKGNTVAMTAHIPPSASLSVLTEYTRDRGLAVSQ
jgi:hypothetical protein